MRILYYDEHTGKFLKKKDLKEPLENYIVYDDSAMKGCVIEHWVVRHNDTLKRLDFAFSYKYERDKAYRMLLEKEKEYDCVLDHRIGYSFDEEMFEKYWAERE